MKTKLLPLLLTSLLFSHCSQSPEAAPKVDYDQRSLDIVREVSSFIVADWELRQVHVKVQPLNVDQAELGLKRDTIFQNFATLSVQPGAPRSSPPSPRYPDFEGFLRFRGKAYPVHFQLIAYPERVVDGRGPQAYFHLSTNFPAGSRHMEPEEAYLRRLGLIGDSFTLEIAPNEPRMTWRGLNRGVARIELQK